jgi:hypothetical protein
MTDPTAGSITVQPASIVLQSTITCPKCTHRWTGTMPTDACQYLYVCEACGVELKPKKGDCCVYCSYGDVPCPPIQEERLGGSSAACCCNAKS